MCRSRRKNLPGAVVVASVRGTRMRATHDLRSTDPRAHSPEGWPFSFSARQVAERSDEQPPVGLARRSRASRSIQCRLDLPRGFQGLIIHLPELQRQITQQRRLVIVKVAIHLIDAGVLSFNKTAALLGLAPSTLWAWRDNLLRHGELGLLPKPHGQERLSRKAGPCRLTVVLTG